ncbi:MAG: S8 family serine peptidase [Pyrinomonadaceae bacterium]
MLKPLLISKKIICLFLLLIFAFNTAQAGIEVVRSNGVTLTGADGINFFGTDGVTLTGVDGFLSYKSNGVTLTGADGVTLTGVDGVTLTGADGATYIGPNGVTLTGADGVTLTGADGATFTGPNGVTLTGADGIPYQADSIYVIKPNGVTLTGADGVTLTGVDGFTLIGGNGVTLTGADGVTLTGVDGVTLTGADTIVGLGPDGVVFQLNQPSGVTLTGVDGVTLTGADGINITGAQGVTLTGADGQTGSGPETGLLSIDPELAIWLNEAADDSNVNAVIVFHHYPDNSDLNDLQQIGILGGTLYRKLPMVVVTATKAQLLAVSRLASVRSISGNRTLNLNSDPYFKNSGIEKVAADPDLINHNNGLPVSGRGVTVAVLDTGINSLHPDLNGRVSQNVRLFDFQSAPLGFLNPVPTENVENTDPVSGHGTFVSGIIAGSGGASGGQYDGVAPDAKLLGLSAGDLNLTYILAGFDYLLDKGAEYNTRVVNCSFSSNTVYDPGDPVNVATKLVTEAGISVVFSAGNSGPGSGTLNPFAAAPWVISVGAVDEKNKLADFSSRGVFGDQILKPSLVASGVNVVSLRGGVNQTGVLGVLTGADTQRLTASELANYTTASGTSFTAPQVAGAIALMLEANPQLSPAKIKEILLDTATPLPNYFQHEVGSGALNTHAAVLEAAFAGRKFGFGRAGLKGKSVKFSRSVPQTFDGTVSLLLSSSKTFSLPADQLRAEVKVHWGLGANDLSLKLYDGQNQLVGTSNNLNALGLLGNREKIQIENPPAQTYKAVVANTLGIGTTQKYYGAVETISADYSEIGDLDEISAEWLPVAKESLRKFLIIPKGGKFKPNFAVTRKELAEGLVRSGRVMKYLAAQPIYSDVQNLTDRIAVESVQKNESGMLVFDAPSGEPFRPFDKADKLIAAVALVRAAGLEDQAMTATLPSNLTDASSIPEQFRGYVAIALEKGLVAADGNNFNPARPVTRLELSLGLVNLIRL